MTSLHYKDAQKLANKEYHNCLSLGEDPYLPVLDELIPTELLNHGVPLGNFDIPTEFIVGTRSSGRTTAFARNFMPLMRDGSEFAVKWQAVCKAHLDEGLRDAVKVYEYMNRYYVQEGNKRVSVLKFFGADTVYANVTRIPPKQDGTRKVQLYNEYVEFFRYSRVNFIEFSKPGSYVQLGLLLGKKAGEVWSEEDRREFSSVFHIFRKEYENMGGDELSSTVGDALLAFLQVYGYPIVCGFSSGDMRKMLTKTWEEITLQQEETPIDVKLTPDTKKPDLLAKVLTVGEKKQKKVAFIHDKDPMTSGWTRGHEQGRRHVQEVFGDKIETTSYFNAMDNDPRIVIEQAIADGNTTIFTTSPLLLPASLRAAIVHPEVAVLNCSLNTSHRYIRTYYARMYEAKFVIGAIAGALAGNDNVGYICDYPIFGQIAGINAFALGVQMVNPRAKIYLEWSAKDGFDAAMKRLTDRGIRLISSQDKRKRGHEHHVSFGLSLVTEGSQVVLAVPVWQWGTYYEALLRRIQNKSFQAEYEESGKAVNYFWGMSAGVVELDCSDKVPPSTRKMAELLQNNIRADFCRPFQGKLYTKNGKVIEGDLTAQEIIDMDWLMENIEGAIPEYNELTETGKATVDLVGVDSAVKDVKGKK